MLRISFASFTKCILGGFKIQVLDSKDRVLQDLTPAGQFAGTGDKNVRVAGSQTMRTALEYNLYDVMQSQ